MVKGKVRDELLLAWAESDDYKKGRHQEKDNTRDNNTHTDEVKKNQDLALDRHVP